MYLSAVGFGMVLGGIFVEDEDNQEFYSDEFDRAYRLMFAGGLITTFFWVSDQICLLK